eukprot:314902-Rhodomonas_salina.1
MDEDGRGGVVSSTGNRGSVWRRTDAYASKGGDSEEQMSLAARRGSEGEGQGRMGQRKHEAGKGPFRSERRKSSLNKEHVTNRRQHQRPKPVLTRLNKFFPHVTCSQATPVFPSAGRHPSLPPGLNTRPCVPILSNW